jgi:hypothetical protein
MTRAAIIQQGVLVGVPNWHSVIVSGSKYRIVEMYCWHQLIVMMLIFSGH